MKRRLLILFIACTGGILFAQIVNSKSSQIVNSKLSNSKYIDDSYYWPVIDTLSPSTPKYDKNAREFIFLEDTTQHPDTVRMRIIER